MAFAAFLPAPGLAGRYFLAAADSTERLGDSFLTATCSVSWMYRRLVIARSPRLMSGHKNAQPSAVKTSGTPH